MSGTWEQMLADEERLSRVNGRTYPPLPNEPWSMVLPRDGESRDAFVLNASGQWRAVQEWEVAPSEVAQCLAAGTHYVKGTDQQIGRTAHQTEGETE